MPGIGLIWMTFLISSPKRSGLVPGAASECGNAGQSYELVLPFVCRRRGWNIASVTDRVAQLIELYAGLGRSLENWYGQACLLSRPKDCRQL